MLILTQKTHTVNDETFGFVTVTLKIGVYTYNIRFDEKTKKRFYNYARSQGFRVGKLNDGETITEYSKEVL